MRQDDEQGFLAGKFDDWSGEPIPNGWNSIESKIKKEKTRRNLLISAVPAILLLSFWLQSSKNSLSPVSPKNTGLSQTEGKILPAVASVQIRKASPADASTGSVSLDEKHPSTQQVQAADVSRPAESKSIENQVYSGFTAAESGVSPQSGFEETETEQVQPSFSAGLFAETGQPDFSSESGFLLSKSVQFLLPDFESATGKPGITRENKKYKTPASWFNKSFTLYAAYAVSTIEIDHALSEDWRYSPGKNNFSRAGMVSAGVRIEKSLKRNLALFYGMEGGLFLRETELLATSRMPVSYSIQQDGDSRYSVNPELKLQNEIRRSSLLFARSEIGVRQALTRNSGFLASGQCWAGISSSSSSSQADAAGFHAAASSLAFGYRAGAWMQTGPFTQVEFSYSYMPESLVPSTSGLQFRTRMLGLSLKQTF